jgi:hypothetical protein
MNDNGSIIFSGSVHNYSQGFSVLWSAVYGRGTGRGDADAAPG